MTISFQLTKDEYSEAGKIFLNNSKKQYFKLAIFIMFFIFVANLLTDTILQSAISALFYSIGIFFLILFLLFFQYKIKFYKDKIYSKPVTIILSEKGFELEYTEGIIFLKWKAFKNFICNSKVCILFTDKSCGHIIPINSLNDEELQQLKKILSDNIKTVSI